MQEMQEDGFIPRVGKIPWRSKWQPTAVFLPVKFHEQRSLVGYSPRGSKESDLTGWLSMTGHVLKTTSWVISAVKYVRAN